MICAEEEVPRAGAGECNWFRMARQYDAGTIRTVRYGTEDVTERRTLACGCGHFSISNSQSHGPEPGPATVSGNAARSPDLSTSAGPPISSAAPAAASPLPPGSTAAHHNERRESQNRPDDGHRLPERPVALLLDLGRRRRRRARRRRVEHGGPCRANKGMHDGSAATPSLRAHASSTWRSLAAARGCWGKPERRGNAKKARDLARQGNQRQGKSNDR